MILPINIKKMHYSVVKPINKASICISITTVIIYSKIIVNGNILPLIQWQYLASENLPPNKDYS